MKGKSSPQLQSASWDLSGDRRGCAGGEACRQQVRKRARERRQGNAAAAADLVEAEGETTGDVATTPRLAEWEAELAAAEGRGYSGTPANSSAHPVDGVLSTPRRLDQAAIMSPSLCCRENASAQDAPTSAGLFSTTLLFSITSSLRNGRSNANACGKACQSPMKTSPDRSAETRGRFETPHGVWEAHREI